MTVDQAMAIKNTQIVEELNLPPVKIHCSVLAEDAIKSAIADYKKKQAAKLSSAADRRETTSWPSAFQNERCRRSRRRRPSGASLPKGLRVGIRGGGCTGFSYLFEWSDQEPRPEDKVLAYEDGHGAGVRRSQEPRLPRRLDPGLRDHADGPRVQVA